MNCINVKSERKWLLITFSRDEYWSTLNVVAHRFCWLPVSACVDYFRASWCTARRLKLWSWFLSSLDLGEQLLIECLLSSAGWRLSVRPAPSPPCFHTPSPEFKRSVSSPSAPECSLRPLFGCPGWRPGEVMRRFLYCKVVLTTSLVWVLVDVFLLLYFSECNKCDDRKDRSLLPALRGESTNILLHLPFTVQIDYEIFSIFRVCWNCKIPQKKCKTFSGDLKG